MRPYRVISPFPISELSTSYDWHKVTSTILSGTTHTLRQYLAVCKGFWAKSGMRTWGVEQGSSLVGIVLFDPIWRGGELVDGSLHIALARRVWGRSVLETVAPEILGDLFTSIPTLLRVSGYTPSHYSPGLAVAKHLGFTPCGELHDAVRIGGKIRGMTITELTRSNWNEHISRTDN